MQFDREKAPERIVHARGMTAKGYFEVTHDISHLTSAAFLKRRWHQGMTEHRSNLEGS